ncbi:hypothetical protein M1146_04070 [Patescibacteria group bacterium]|nr:hypothetical protein [Patescibacteria group bacterium]
MGLNVYVESGLISATVQAALRSTHNEDGCPLWIGMSVGVKSSTKLKPKAGTLGAFLKSNDQYYALTARHVVSDNGKEVPHEIDAPPNGDFLLLPKSIRPTQQSLQVYYAPEFAQEVEHSVMNERIVTSVDAALLKVEAVDTDAYYRY